MLLPQRKMIIKAHSSTLMIRLRNDWESDLAVRSRQVSVMWNEWSEVNHEKKEKKKKKRNERCLIKLKWMRQAAQESGWGEYLYFIRFLPSCQCYRRSFFPSFSPWATCCMNFFSSGSCILGLLSIFIRKVVFPCCRRRWAGIENERLASLTLV